MARGSLKRYALGAGLGLTVLGASLMAWEALGQGLPETTPTQPGSQSIGAALKHGDAPAQPPTPELATTDSIDNIHGADQLERANGNEPEIPPPVSWSFTGIFGRYDLAQLQRGFKVYKEVCSNCHALDMVAFRNLEDLGYTPAQVKAFAETYQIEDGPDAKGQMFKRPGRPSDYFPPPFPNPQAAAAIFGKAPPNMSTLAKARAWERGFPAFVFDFFTQSEEAEGPTYIHAVLNGYTKPDDPKYNIYMANHRIAMPKPLSDGQVEYTDGAPQTLAQYSKDVSAFLMWAAEPKLEQRKAMGVRVMVFLVVFASLLFFVKKRIWKAVGGDVVIGAP